VRRPFESLMIWQQIEDIGWKSLPLILSAGFAVGLVLTFHTRSTLLRFGAQAMIPAFQSLAFFNEMGPLTAGLLVAGRVGAGIGAELADLRVSEQIDAIEAFSIDSFKLLVIPRILACIIALPILTVFMDVAGLIGGYVAEGGVSHLSVQLYLTRAFSDVSWANFITLQAGGHRFDPGHVHQPSSWKFNYLVGWTFLRLPKLESVRVR